MSPFNLAIVTVTADAAASSGNPDTVTLVTGGLLALAAIVSSLTPIVLARRRARREALAAATATAANSGDLTLAGWTSLNAALQQEITRLQGVTERMQARIDLLEDEIAKLQKLAGWASRKNRPVPDLVLVFLLVSCLSLVFQLLAFIRLAARRAYTPAEELVGGGYIRTVGCRVLAATIYVVVAGIQLAGSGTLTGEALIVFGSVQAIWLVNSMLDIRIRRTLSQAGGLMPDEDARQQIARVAAVADDLDKILDKLFATVANLKVILTSTGGPRTPGTGTTKEEP